jgi:hypothetical protein
LTSRGVTDFVQLDQVKRTRRETGRIFSVNFAGRFEGRAVTRAAEFVAAGEIGQVLQTIGLGPHRLDRHLRPDWFFRKEMFGGILVDIGCHQIDQFLFFTGSSDAQIVAARAGNLAHPGDPGFEDFGEILLATGSASGYIRVDWFTPDGLPTWGDGRLTILGTEGYIELRTHIDIAGRPGKDHLFLVNKYGTRYVDCSDAALPYYKSVERDVFERGESAMPQAHCFKVCELALDAQAKARAPPDDGAEGTVVGAGHNIRLLLAWPRRFSLLFLALVASTSRTAGVLLSFEGKNIFCGQLASELRFPPCAKRLQRQALGDGADISVVRPRRAENIREDQRVRHPAFCRDQGRFLADPSRRGFLALDVLRPTHRPRRAPDGFELHDFRHRYQSLGEPRRQGHVGLPRLWPDPDHPTRLHRRSQVNWCRLQETACRVPNNRVGKDCHANHQWQSSEQFDVGSLGRFHQSIDRMQVDNRVRERRRPNASIDEDSGSLDLETVILTGPPDLAAPSPNDSCV